MDRNSSEVKPSQRAERALLVIAFAIILWLAIEAWFNPLQFRVFAGDDMDTFSRNQTLTSPPIRSVAVMYHKFRPVAATVIFGIAKLTNCDFQKIASISVAIHAANALIFFSLLYRSIKLPLALSVGVTVIAIFNRFATYLLMQDEAIMEGIGVFLFIWMLIVALSFIERPTVRCSLGLAALFTSLVYVHERYLVLAVPLALVSVGTFNRNRKTGVLLTVGVTLGALSYLCIKKFWFGAPILVGSQTIPIDFGIGQIGSFLWHGALNLVGINSGPAHLSLENFPDSPPWIKFVSVTVAILSCSLVAGAVATIVLSSAGKDRRASLLRVGFYLSTTVLLLLSASITVRQEFRWLYPAFLVFLCWLGYGITLGGTRQAWFRLALTCLVLLSLCQEVYFARRIKRFFSFESYQIANNLFTALHHISGALQKDAVLIRGDVPVKEWIFGEGTFSRFYHLPALEFVAAGSIIEQTDESRLVLDYDPSDRNFKLSCDQPAAIDQSHRMNYSLLEHSSAALTPDNRWSTPTKTPVFVTSKNGVNCVAVVAPVDLIFAVPKGASVLHLCFSQIYAMGDGTDVDVAAKSPDGSRTLLSRRVPPLTNDDSPVWRKYEFALPAGTQEVELHVFSQTDPVADWIAVRDFSLN
jgi:hypothetical protein